MRLPREWPIWKIVLVIVCLLAVHDMWTTSDSQSIALKTCLSSLAQVTKERERALFLLGQQSVAIAEREKDNTATHLNASVCDEMHLHRVFCKFAPWRGVMLDPRQYAVDFHGVFTNLQFFPTHLTSNADWLVDSVVTASMPNPRSASTFVHTSLLMAIVGSANNSLVVADFGAGWGHWLGTAHHASKRLWGDRVRVELLGIEAEPTHYKYLEEHMLFNGIDARQHRFLNQVVHSGSEFISRLPFYVGRANEWYGQCIANDGRRGELKAELPAINVNQVLRSAVHGIDWLQVDIGGYHGAFELVRGGIDEMRRRVRWLVVRTVDPTEHAAVRELLREWWILSDYIGQSEPHTTPWGQVTFENGLLVALNRDRVEANHFMH